LISGHSEPFIERISGHLDIAIICTRYQSFQCFNKAISDEQAIGYIRNGDIRLLDYMRSNWLGHIKLLSERSLNPPDNGGVAELTIALRELFVQKGLLFKHMDDPKALVMTKAAEQDEGIPQSETENSSFSIFEPEVRTGLLKLEVFRRKLEQRLLNGESLDSKFNSHHQKPGGNNGIR
jgi:hypothetical protein